jgi:hypothetical protein
MGPILLWNEVASDFVWWRTPKVTLFCDSSWLPLGASLTNHLGAYSDAS